MSNTVAASKPKLSDILQELIREKGLSVSELARRINLPQPTLQRMTTGMHSNPHKKTLSIIAGYFGVTMDQLRGLEPIPWLSIQSNSVLQRIPIINQLQASNWPALLNENVQYLSVDKKISERAYAMQMPDASMEPLIPKGSMLIVDPTKTPHHRSFVVVKLKNSSEVIIRQLITDAKNCYIKALSSDLEQFGMVMIGNQDLVGVVLEVRLYCEDY